MKTKKNTGKKKTQAPQASLTGSGGYAADIARELGHVALAEFIGEHCAN